MARRLVLGTWLIVVWCFLWEDFSLGVILGGFLLSMFILALAPPDNSQWIVIRPLPAIRYLAFFLYSLVKSSLSTAKVVLNPKSDPQGGIIEVTLDFTMPVLVTIVASSISLTPGTLSVDARKSGSNTLLYVHVMTPDNLDDERAGIAHLEKLVTQAFAPKSVLAEKLEKTEAKQA